MQTALQVQVLLCSSVQCALSYAQVFNIVEAKKAVSPQFYVSKILPVGLSMALAVRDAGCARCRAC